MHLKLGLNCKLKVSISIRMLICYNTIYLDLVFEEIQGVIY